MPSLTDEVATEPPIWQLRPLFATIEAFQYDGSFPLSFLRAGETVRKAAAGSSAVVIDQGGNESLVNLWDYVVRDLRSGRIRAESASGWFSRYERTSGRGEVDGD